MIANNIVGGEYHDKDCDPTIHENITYKITSGDSFDPTDDGAFATINRSTTEDRIRYRFLIRQLSHETITPPEYLGE